MFQQPFYTPEERNHSLVLENTKLFKDVNFSAFGQQPQKDELETFTQDILNMQEYSHYPFYSFVFYCFLIISNL
jgi:hypothetical protein